jgi:hypothetical protein
MRVLGIYPFVPRNLTKSGTLLSITGGVLYPTHGHVLPLLPHNTEVQRLGRTPSPLSKPTVRNSVLHQTRDCGSFGHTPSPIECAKKDVCNFLLQLLSTNSLRWHAIFLCTLIQVGFRLILLPRHPVGSSTPASWPNSYGPI